MSISRKGILLCPWVMGQGQMNRMGEKRFGRTDRQTDGRTGQKHICLQPVGQRHNKLRMLISCGDPTIRNMTVNVALSVTGV